MSDPLVTTILTQYHMSKGLKVFGEPGLAAFLKELKKLHNRMVTDPKNADDMTKCQKKAALQYLMFLKQKICGNIKGRGCVDGRNKRNYLTKDDTSVQTVAMEALLIICLIDTMEHQ